LIIVRNLLAGCRTFGELLEGAPGISRALLAQRLVLLEQYEVIVREVARGRVRYALTERGQELRAVVRVLGEWGARWLELEPHHSDPAYVLFATSRLVDVERAPAHGLVVRFELDDRHYWLLVRRPRAEVCTSYPGRPEDLVVRTRSEVLARCHLRHTTFAQAERHRARVPRVHPAEPVRRHGVNVPLTIGTASARRLREGGGVVAEEQPGDQVAA
jgi:DNA-binding HxlR family transcriptional regulator